MEFQPNVLYEDEYMVAINKLAGMFVHPESAETTETTLTDWLSETYSGIQGVGEQQTLRDGTVIDRPGIVHRLDRETSGVLVVAKTQAAFEQLKAAFQDGAVSKTYLAFVYGILTEKRGTIDRAIGRSAKDFRLRSAQRGARGTLRPAVTDYEVLGESADESVSLIAAYPRTGRTHQIRVHCKAIHHPVVCDDRYAPNQPCLLGFRRLALHARAITVPNEHGESVTVTAPLPADFVSACEESGIAAAADE